MSIIKLVSLMPPPAGVVRNLGTDRWAAVEHDLGIALPEDYKEFIDIYEVGKIAGFISIFSPFTNNNNLNIKSQITRQANILNELQSLGEVLPYPIFPTPGGLLPVGMTDNGDVIYWRTSAKEWSIAINESRGPEWESHNSSLTDFLFGILSGDLTCAIFPKLPTAPPIKFIASVQQT